MMDKERQRRELERYGGRTVPRLMEEKELPAVYLVDIEADTRARANAPVEQTGRGARSRRDVRYDDGLTEEQWLDAVEEGELEAFQAKAARRARRSGKTTGSEISDDSDDDDASSVGTREMSATPTPGAVPRRRGRPPKSKLNQVLGDGSSNGSSPAPSEKRGRGRPSKNKKIFGDDSDGPSRKRARHGDDDSSVPISRRRAIQKACEIVLAGIESVEVGDEEDEEG